MGRTMSTMRFPRRGGVRGDIMLLLLAVFLLVVVSTSHVRQFLMPDHAVTSTSEYECAPENEEIEYKVTPPNLENITVPPEVLAEAKPLPHNIAVCTMVQNEALYVAEWIAYHRLLGVDHFIFYNNNSTDNLEEALAPFAARGWVSVINNDRELKGNEAIDFQDQCDQSNEEALSSRWLGLFDVDEFLIVPGANLETQLLSLPRILDHYEQVLNCTGIEIDRYSFGSGPHIERPKTGLVIENYVERKIEEAKSRVDLYPKTFRMPNIMKLDKVHGKQHFFNLKESNGPACLADTRFVNRHDRTKVFEPFRFHHYELRSKEDCEEKLERRRKDMGELDWRVKTGNALCERGVHGGESYSPEIYVTDLTLASSKWPSMIRAFLKEVNGGIEVSV
jgi:hypothetical protein